MWGIVIVALFDIPKGKDGKMNIFQWIFEYLQFWHWESINLRKILNFPKILRQNRSYVALSIPFILVLISGLWSEDLHYWLSRVQLRLPFLLLPFAFSQMPPLSKKHFQSLLAFFLIIISVNILFVLM